MYSASIEKTSRHFLPQDFIVSDWQTLEPYLHNLLNRELSSKETLEQWLKDRSELEAVVDEDAYWRQIRMTRDTENKKLQEAFNYFQLHIQPQLKSSIDALNRKLLNTPVVSELDQDKYFIYLRNIRKSIELFREENIPLQAEISILQQRYGQTVGAMTVIIDGQQYTLQQAAKFLQSSDRDLRKEAYLKIQERRLQDKDLLDDLFNTLITIRHKEAQNAGFDNFRDFRFKDLGRFDYTKEDCFNFHEAVKKHVLPLVNEILTKKKERLGIESLRPWDLEAEPEGIEPLKPFDGSHELLEKSILCMKKLNPFFGDCLEIMKNLDHLDLESRKGKAPGGYNCPLPETGVPFIFMNAVGQMHDVTTMVHEGGHAVHSFLVHNLELTAFKEYPIEIAEVASMTMELFTMDYWDIFFSNPSDLTRAKQHQLERVITLFPWIAIIDKFQHWIYENPEHTNQERTSEWLKILSEFSDEVVDYTELEKFRANGWQKQLHLFEVPFYYIEYGIAQLGAIGLWMQYKENPQKAIENYCKALSLGGTRALPDLYKTAGLRFDFSPSHINTLMNFVSKELKKLE